MPNTSGNIPNSQRNPMPKMQTGFVKNTNSSKGVRQSAAPAYKKPASNISMKQSTAENIYQHQEDWKATPEGIKYRLNYDGGYRANYGGADPLEKGYKKGPAVSDTAYTNAVSAVYNIAYLIILFICAVFVLRFGIIKSIVVPLLVIFLIVFSARKSLLKKGCLVNIIVYAFVIILLTRLLKINIAL